MTKQAQSMTLRDFLKNELVQKERSLGNFFPGKHRTLTCPLCFNTFTYDPPMHEALLSRGKVQGNAYADFIMSQYNCIFPCIPCHSKMQGVGGETGFRLSAIHLVAREGFAEVRNWLVEAAEKFIAGKEALNRFDAIFQVGNKD